MVGRKRHIAADTDGRLFMVRLTSADSAGAQAILTAGPGLLKYLFADGAHDRLKLMDKAAHLDLVTGLIGRSDTQKRFGVLRHRRVVERSFGWSRRPGP